MKHILLILFTQYGFITTYSQPLHAYIDSLEIPVQPKAEDPVHHKAYVVSYNHLHKQPNWVAYKLKGSNTLSVIEREDGFHPDPHYRAKTANDKDYERSGYDRGHLAPAADMAWSEPTMKESFYYTNISPQRPAFNRGIWKEVEERVRHWARMYDSVYVVTGPVFSDTLPTIGANHVTVPVYFYKAVLQYSSSQVKGIAFIIPNTHCNETPAHYVVSIDSIEQVTGINFFPRLPDETENQIEKQSTIAQWEWGNEKVRTDIAPEGNTTRDTRLQEKNITTTVQCSGTTKSGKQCKRMTTSASGRCYQHE